MGGPDSPLQYSPQIPGSEAPGWRLPAVSTSEDGEQDSEVGCAKARCEPRQPAEAVRGTCCGVVDRLDWWRPLLGKELYDMADHSVQRGRGSLKGAVASCGAVCTVTSGCSQGLSM